MYGRGTKRRLQGASATCRSLCRVGPTDANHIFRSTGTVPRSGWEDASRNTATFAVSREHRAGPGRSGRPNRTSTRESGGGREKASRLRDRRAGPSREPSGWANFAKKDNAGRRLCTNPAGPLIGVTVFLPGHRFTRITGFFSSPDATTSAGFSPSQKLLIVFSGTPRVPYG